MSEQTKREAGASRKATRRQRIDITLAQEILDFIDDQPVSRSRFIEMVIWNMPEFQDWRLHGHITKEIQAIIQQDQQERRGHVCTMKGATIVTEYERGQRDIQDWLTHNRKEDIPWKIERCLENYPDNPYYQPYYDAMLVALREAMR